MKIRLKILLCFSACALLMTAATGIITNHIFGKETSADRLDEYRLMLRQTLNSMDLAAQDIEADLLSQHTGINFAQSVTDGDALPAVRERNIISKLRYMCYNSDYFEAMAFVDNNGERFFAGANLTEAFTDFSASIDEHFLQLQEQYTQWFSDLAGHIYLKKDIYEVAPLYRCGILIARLDADRLRSLLAFDTISQRSGTIILLDSKGEFLTSTGSLPTQQAMNILHEHHREITDGQSIIMHNDTEYYAQQDSLAHSWQIIHLVSQKDMMALPHRVARTNLIVCFFIFAAFVPLLLLFSHTLTHGVKTLHNAMNEVSQGNFNIKFQNVSGDEIGQLSLHFQRLLKQLQTLTEQMVNRATEKQQAEYELLEIKYRSLLSQVSPHFICNILTTVNALSALGHSDQVCDLAVLASQFFRNNMRASDQKLVTLKQEVCYVEDYMEIYHAIYGDRVCLSINVPQAALQLAVPGMILQPLVENALVHGGLGGVPDGQISIGAELQGDTLHLTLKDNGKGIDPALLDELNEALVCQNPDRHLKGFGLRGVVQRLRLLYGTSQRIQITSSHRETQIAITLPAVYYQTDDMQPDALASPPEAPA